jgi:LDH2 family malate/lactate/ureidoglycolate dehydrogenase
MLPGEPELKVRAQRQRTGIAMPTAVWHQITELAERLGVEVTSSEDTA